MAVAGDLGRLWRRAFDAYVAYYRSVGRLTANYARAVAGTAGELRPGPSEQPTARPTTAASAPATMALEAEVGAVAVGMFVVENSGLSRVSGALELSSLIDPNGQDVHPELGFEPERVTLEPGEQMVVQAAVKIDRSLRTGVDYRGEVSVPGLPGTRVPIVVRRLASRRRPASGRIDSAA
jgi:hypothetical protein